MNANKLEAAMAATTFFVDMMFQLHKFEAPPAFD